MMITGLTYIESQIYNREIISKMLTNVKGYFVVILKFFCLLWAKVKNYATKYFKTYLGDQKSEIFCIS